MFNGYDVTKYDNSIEAKVDSIIDSIKKEKNCLVAVIENDDEDTVEKVEFSKEELEEATKWYWDNEWKKDVVILYADAEITNEEDE